MSVLKRVSDILSANFHELIERYEDPKLILKQAVHEMEESIRAALENAAKVVAHEKILARQLAEEESAIVAIRRRAESAIQRGDDTDAREALRHKREREINSKSLAKQLAEVANAGQTLRQQIEAMRRRVDEAKRKLVLLAARQRAAEARRQLIRQFSDVTLGDEAFHKFDRMCRKVEQTEAETDALAELAHDPARSLVWAGPCDQMSTDEIENELRDLKAKGADEEALVE